MVDFFEQLGYDVEGIGFEFGLDHMTTVKPSFVSVYFKSFIQGAYKQQYL